MIQMFGRKQITRTCARSFTKPSNGFRRFVQQHHHFNFFHYLCVHLYYIYHYRPHVLDRAVSIIPCAVMGRQRNFVSVQRFTTEGNCYR